jgi:phenylalanyl-tRNA synthetase beta chain
MLAVEPKIAQWKAVSRFPSTDLDLAFAVPESVAADKVDKAIRQAAAGLLVGLDLFDVFRGPGLEPGTRSLAYRLRLQAPDRTLTDAEVATVKDKAVAVMAKMGGVLRG